VAQYGVTSLAEPVHVDDASGLTFHAAAEAAMRQKLLLRDAAGTVSRDFVSATIFLVECQA
jgi:hypothetical protein